MFTLHSDHINNVVEIRRGFSVDYTPNQQYTDYNNNGTWGRITDRGEIVASTAFNVNVWKGEDCYTSVLSKMKAKLVELRK